MTARPLFAKVLVANRGEVALRIVRALHDVALPSVAVYADDDAASPHVQAADEAVALVLLCHKRIRALTRRQHGHRGSVCTKAAAIRSRKLVIDDGTWRCVRWAAARLVMCG